MFVYLILNREFDDVSFKFKRKERKG
jgi:hypothetical protein